MKSKREKNSISSSSLKCEKQNEKTIEVNIIYSAGII